MKLKDLKKEVKVKINSKGEYLLLIDLAEKAGYKWFSGANPTSFNDNERYYQSDCIAFYPKDIQKRIGRSDLYGTCVPLKKVIKFEVGDKVMVRKDLASCDKMEEPRITPSLLNCAEKEFTISCILPKVGSDKKTYTFNKDVFRFQWIKKWFEPVLPTEEEKTDDIAIGDRVRVVNTGALYTTNVDKVIEMTNNKNVLARYAYGDDKGYTRGEKTIILGTYHVLNVDDDGRLLIQKNNYYTNAYSDSGEVLLINKRGVKKC